VATGVMWVRSYLVPWNTDLVRDRGDFRLRMSSENGTFRIGETHHFEEWRIGYAGPCRRTGHLAGVVAESPDASRPESRRITA
jgi:hypothetical protein